MAEQNNPLLQAIMSALIAGTPSQQPAPQPQVDLGRIDINKQIPQEPVQPMTMPQSQSSMVQQRPQPQLDENGQTPIGRFLSQLGIPLATAAVGLAGGGNGVTAGAAGFQGGYTAEKQQQHKDKMEQKKLDFEQKKIDIQNQREQRLFENQMRQNEILDRLIPKGDGGQSNVPPGTTVRVGGVNYQANRPLDEAERKTLQAAPVISDAVDNINNLIKDGVGSSTLERIGIDSGSPLLAGGKAEELQSQLNYLKSSVTFSDAGKQLTDSEKQIMYNLLNITGKDNKTIERDLGRFKDKFEKIDELIRYGRNNPNVPPQVLEKAKQEILKDLNKNMHLDANTAQQILQEAGGDKAKAREIAKQRGYSF